MENKGMFPFHLMLSFWVFFCFASFLPLKSDIPGWVVCLSLSLWWSWHGDVLCFALSVVSYQHTSQWGGSEHIRGQESWILRPGSCAASHRLQKACSAWSPVSGSLTMIIVKWEQSWGFASICTLSPCSAPLPPTRVYVSAHSYVPWQSWCWVMFPIQLRGPGGLSWDAHFRRIMV